MVVVGVMVVMMERKERSGMKVLNLKIEREILNGF
jgi:hypothetical protein